MRGGHGSAEVESILDAAHALMSQGVFRYRRAAKLNLAEYERRRRERLANEEQNTAISGARCRYRAQRAASRP